MPLRISSVDADGHIVDLFYLMTRAEADPYASPDECGPVASGMECKWMERARCQREAGMDDAQWSLRNADRWRDIADRLWLKACNDLTAGLPWLDVFLVIPSSCAERRDSLVDALRARCPNAIELIYSRSSSGGKFGHSEEDMIFQDLIRQCDAVTGILRRDCR